MIFIKANSQQPVEVMSLKLSEDATTIVAILYTLLASTGGTLRLGGHTLESMD